MSLLNDQLVERAATSAGVILLVTASLWLLHLVRTLWRLRHVPGPLLSKFTDLYRAQLVRTLRSHEIHQGFHDRYGAVVRLGPRMVSVSDPAAIPTIYPMRPGFPKGDFYEAFIPYLPGGSLPAIFTARDENLHKRLKSPVASLYNLSSIMKCEPSVDETLDVLFEQLDTRFVATGKTVELADWLQYFAFDVMGTMTFSKRYGFLESGADNLGISTGIWNFMLTVGPMTQVPWLDKILHKNAIAAKLKKASGNKIMQIAADAVAERKAETAAKSESNGNGNGHSHKSAKQDFLGEFLKLQSASESSPPWAPLVWTFSNIIAGSDSTAVVMRTTLYHLLTHPSDLARVRAELDALPNLTTTAETSKEGFKYPRWTDLNTLPYLSACVDEAVRLHPPFCLALEREVPASGVVVCGTYLEPGTRVGMNPYVVNRHKGTFGEDAEVWRPGRWLEGDEEHRRKLAGSVMTFGAGRRVCLGKALGVLEVKKVVAALVVNYEIDLIDPKAYTVENSYFFRQKGILAKLRRRQA
ncbi:cytochrome P450 [Dichotomopilus funicola]|uniref:Cytochrome P450 n=1 Tax=Dichotomopilus funicola TaxID=1934379 RepID=A0AAN6UW94_9PEZI|nr:cytochrome P450 [Dichotomopilus funicola]